jgi:hypothetical protein
MAKLLTAALAASLLAGSAGMALAQGSVTQDPGRITPGNLTFQRLGPTEATPETRDTGPSRSKPGTAGRNTPAGLPRSGSSSGSPGASPSSGLGSSSPGGR